MGRSITVEVEPKILYWLRTSSGWSLEDVSKRLKTRVGIMEAIEKGERRPTFRQLKELARAYERPLASFFLKTPIPEASPPKDYRMLPDRVGVFDRRTIHAIRRARGLQDVLNELSINIDRSIHPVVEKFSIHDDPIQIARDHREHFQLDGGIQRKYKTPYEMFNNLRGRFEDRNIHVFQFSMPIEDARGFVFTDREPYVIVVNTKDRIEARLFTLMHEFGHVLLGETIIDIPDITASTDDRTESWCNEFASDFLIPTDLAHAIFEANKDSLHETGTLNSLSRRYKVSKGMLLYKMVKLGYISVDRYRQVLGRYRAPANPEIEKKKKRTGGIPAERRCLSEVGSRYVSIVANNYDHDHITYADALNYLAIRSKNFDKVLSKAR